MIPLLTLIGPALVLGFLLGAVVGRFAGLPRTGPTLAGTLALVLAAAVAGGLSLAGLVPGRAGLWVEVGALILAAYLAGAAVGAVSLGRQAA
ncbi:hypothetical protein ASF22_14930 [Methylobacterium sp. Leaf87]|uniref:hypothetical protein n=1 Tax=Methylobacterium sp. Leaf87 TaxID=1736243 RepID=UPI0007010C0B|nr:hypothetical protein [Methylobacterium sp. Leaf87]KQO71233.1 hypothetical protein ASF22_14930 [Methylobacterium sp. Leaf87]